MKVALYARVSKPQRNHEADVQAKEQNPAVQLYDLREWCAREGHRIVVEYVDRKTGKNTNRPQLQKMLRDIERGLQDIDAVVVWRLDRFGRSVRDLYNLCELLKSAGVSLISKKDGFDLSSSGGKLLFGILAVFAEFERNVIAERTAAGLALARSEGRVPGRKIDPKRGPSPTTKWRQKQRAMAASA